MNMVNFCSETLNSVPALLHCGPGKVPHLSELVSSAEKPLLWNLTCGVSARGFTKPRMSVVSISKPLKNEEEGR